MNGPDAYYKMVVSSRVDIYRESTNESTAYCEFTEARCASYRLRGGAYQYLRIKDCHGVLGRKRPRWRRNQRTNSRGPLPCD